METDTDIVLAQDKNGNIVFIKTFKDHERIEMIKAYEYVRTLKDCTYRLCGIDRITIDTLIF